LFAAQGVEVRYHGYDHPVYGQAHAGFEPNMAALDLLFNAGPKSREIMLQQEHVPA
jgi:hypothetical protein